MKFWAIRNKKTGLFFPECVPTKKRFSGKQVLTATTKPQVASRERVVYGWTHRDVNVDITNCTEWPHCFENRNEAGRILDMWLRGRCLNNNNISRDPHDPNCGKRWIKEPERKAEDMEIVELKLEVA